ncbi:MAG: hypothetical protein AMJ62_03975 [Myxococcales bacterium SG8_38]|nr:MAG: hypothetical protein AMJ62_03975 [Myxococcales bacterium SG8_38]
MTQVCVTGSQTWGATHCAVTVHPPLEPPVPPAPPPPAPGSEPPQPMKIQPTITTQALRAV